MDVWLSEPRLFYFPMSLALLINIVLMEFPDNKNKEFIATDEWRSVIRKNENLILRPFFEACHEFFPRKGQEQKNQPLFINDFYYDN